MGKNKGNGPGVKKEVVKHKKMIKVLEAGSGKTHWIEEK